MSKKYQRTKEFRNIHTHTIRELAEYAHGRMQKVYGMMVIFIRPDGRVRVIKDDLLEDDTGVGVVGRFYKSHSVEQIEEKLSTFITNNAEYLDTLAPS